jgi:hypothetical protein
MISGSRLLTAPFSVLNCQPRQLLNLLPDLHDLQWTIGPVILPADHKVTTVEWMPMIDIVSTALLELDLNALPSIIATVDASLSLAVRKHGVDCLYQKTELIANHTE